jgi:hypothetical protein
LSALKQPVAENAARASFSVSAIANPENLPAAALPSYRCTWNILVPPRSFALPRDTASCHFCCRFAPALPQNNPVSGMNLPALVESGRLLCWQVRLHGAFIVIVSTPGRGLFHSVARASGA